MTDIMTNKCSICICISCNYITSNNEYCRNIICELCKGKVLKEYCSNCTTERSAYIDKEVQTI